MPFTRGKSIYSYAISYEIDSWTIDINFRWGFGKKGEGEKGECEGKMMKKKLINSFKFFLGGNRNGDILLFNWRCCGGRKC